MIIPRRGLPDPEALAQALVQRDRTAVAAALNLVDDKRPAARDCAARLLTLLPRERIHAGAHLIGMTGPPGVGKSSLTAALIGHWRSMGLQVGVLAVDPSSPISGGALLGDRLRMQSVQGDQGVFIRSLACRGEVGGLSPEVWPMSLVMLAAFDIVLIETVGVGQKEIDISRMSDTTCFVAQPASGDTIQFLKAGIMEIPHILIVNKADLGPIARRTLSDIKATLKQRSEADGWRVVALPASAAKGTGVPEVAATIERHRAWLAEQSELAVRRRGFQAEWVVKRLREDFGRHGIARLGGEARLLSMLQDQDASPFEQFDRLRDRLLDPAVEPLQVQPLERRAR